MSDHFRMFKKTIQRGRSEREAEAYFFPCVEALSDARTKPGVFFNIHGQVQGRDE